MNRENSSLKVEGSLQTTLFHSVVFKKINNTNPKIKVTLKRKTMDNLETFLKANTRNPIRTSTPKAKPLKANTLKASTLRANHHSNDSLSKDLSSLL